MKCDAIVERESDGETVGRSVHVRGQLSDVLKLLILADQRIEKKLAQTFAARVNCLSRERVESLNLIGERDDK